jgi:hypothetical protein
MIGGARAVFRELVRFLGLRHRAFLDAEMRHQTNDFATRKWRIAIAGTNGDNTRAAIRPLNGFCRCPGHGRQDSLASWSVFLVIGLWRECFVPSVPKRAGFPRAC